MGPMTRQSIQSIGAVVLAVACVCGVPRASRAADQSESPGANVLFFGGDVTADYGYPYVGWIHHFNGSVFGDGFLFRLFGFYAPYSYSSNVTPGGHINATAAEMDAMVGYQKVFSPVTLRGFVGPEIENDTLSPDNTFDKNRGFDAGVKFQGELETNYNTPYYANLIGNYGTAKGRYWTRARVGYDFGRVIVGPEGFAIGNQMFDEQRGGAFVTVKNAVGPIWVSLDGGYSAKPATRGGDSGYGAVELSFAF